MAARQKGLVERIDYLLDEGQNLGWFEERQMFRGHVLRRHLILFCINEL